MSLPPATVQIKRKATDEPVDFLRVQESSGKRQRRTRDDNYVFSRQSTILSHQATTNLPPQTKSSRHIKQPHIRTSDNPSRSTTDSQHGQVTSLGRNTDKTTGDDSGSDTTANETQSPITVPNSTSSNIDHVSIQRPAVDGSRPRHFHMKRDLLETRKGRKRAGTHSLTFAEHKIAKRDFQRKKIEISVGLVDSLSEPQSTQSEGSRPQKKPGLATRNDVNTGQEPSGGKPSSIIQSKTPATITLPSGKTMPWDVSSDVLAAEMQAYTLQEIRNNISISNDRSQSASNLPPAHKNLSSKFKPKKPALRYQERYPDEAKALDKIEAMDLDNSSTFEDTDDESEYIIDTYIRVPADTFDSAGSPKNFGLLILDSQPDIDEFYLEEVDSDEEEEFDEDDENAENHYSADYPDDEVDSDDEFNRNAYSYRHDLDEFDEDEATFSDGENDDTKFPWEKRSERRVVI